MNKPLKWILRALCCCVASYLTTVVVSLLLYYIGSPSDSIVLATISTFFTLTITAFVPTYVLTYFFLKRDGILPAPLFHFPIRTIAVYLLTAVSFWLIGFLSAAIGAPGILSGFLPYPACFLISWGMLSVFSKADWHTMGKDLPSKQ